MRGHLPLVAVLLSAMLGAAPASASVIEGVRFAERVEAAETPLRLHGTGLLRYKLVLKGYVAALYLDDSFAERVTSESVLGDVPRRLEIEYFWSIPADAFATATREGIANNTDAALYAELQPSIAAMNALYRDVAPGRRPAHHLDVPPEGRASLRHRHPLSRAGPG